MSIHLTANKDARTGGVYGYSLYVPKRIGAAVPKDAVFEAELHPDGILFRFVGMVPRGSSRSGPVVETPAWARDNGEQK